jgi:hypothetical protein
MEMLEMSWLVAACVILAGYHFDHQLAELMVFSTSEIHYLVTGALVGLGTGFALRKMETLTD